jgi:hypothetical protein
MGGGKSYNDSDIISVFTNSNYESGIWEDNTLLVSDTNSNTPITLFQGTGVGESFYVGSDYTFSGIQIDVTTPVAQTESSLLSHEFWDGSTWVPFTHMDTNSYPPYESFTQSGLEHITSVNTRMGIQSMSMDKKTLNGSLKYWIRISIHSEPLSVLPEYTQLLIHPNTFKINSDGFLEYFGDARPVCSLPLSMGLLRPFKRSNPTNTDVYVSNGLGVGINENTFTKDIDTTSSFTIPFPSRIDTGFPLLMDVTYMVFNSRNGDSKWITRWGSSGNGDSLYVSSAGRPPSGNTERDKTVVIEMDSKQKNTQYQMTIPMDISMLETGDSFSDNLNTLLWLTLERVGSDQEDTFLDKIVIVQVNIKYVKWSEGGSIKTYTTNTPVF